MNGSMAAYWLWWIVAAILIGAELMTGTFYLLAVGLAFAAGGIVAWLGAGLETQMLVAGVLALAGAAAAHRWRTRMGTPPQQPPLDVGQSVHVLAWNADGSARVTYRGTQWNAEVASPGTPRAETMYIVGTRGSTLVLAAQRP
jgi:membrane protein implicated in regulation of membrane protease activity